MPHTIFILSSQENGASKDTIVKKLWDLMDCVFLSDFKIIFFLISRFLLHYGGSIPYIFLPSLMLQKGYTLEQSAFVLSAAALSNTISRFLVCILTDNANGPSAIFITTMGLLSSSIIMFAVPFCYDYITFILAGVMYGFLSAPEAALLSVVLGEITTLSKLNYAFGIVAFVQGIGTICGPPTAGLLIDCYADAEFGFTMSYIFGGICLAISGLASSVTFALNKKTNVINDRAVII